jgi:hypothetical protein
VADDHERHQSHSDKTQDVERESQNRGGDGAAQTTEQVIGETPQALSRVFHGKVGTQPCVTRMATACRHDHGDPSVLHGVHLHCTTGNNTSRAPILARAKREEELSRANHSFFGSRGSGTLSRLTLSVWASGLVPG